MGQTRSEAREMVLSVLRDGNRNDRYLRIAEDGHFFTTPDHTFLTANGRETPLHVSIPVASDATGEEEETWAEYFLDELENKLANAGDAIN